jgi:hypothetical protein
MAHPRRYLIQLWLVIWPSGLLLAAVNPAASLQAVPELTVRFTVFSAVPVDGLSFVPGPDAPPVPVTFYPTARSRQYLYRGSNPLRFYRALTNDPAADPAPSLAAEVMLPSALHDVLLLFASIAPAPAEGPSYRVFVLDDGLGHAPGSMTIINFSGLALDGDIAGKAARLGNGLNPAFTIGRSATIVLRTWFKNRSYQSYADTVELGRGERALLILFPPYRPGSLEVQSRLLLDEPVVMPPARR